MAKEKTTKPQFPQIIYVARDLYFGKDYLIAGLGDQDKDLAQYDVLARYVLQKVGTIEANIKFVPDKK